MKTDINQKEQRPSRNVYKGKPDTRRRQANWTYWKCKMAFQYFHTISKPRAYYYFSTILFLFCWLIHNTTKEDHTSNALFGTYIRLEWIVVF